MAHRSFGNTQFGGDMGERHPAVVLEVRNYGLIKGV
jgi:hypothetical protein